MARLNEGYVLNSTGDQYRIIKYLGEGLTAIVYEAERLTANTNDRDYPASVHVAVKVLQDGLPDDIRRNFRDEADVIAKLSHEETKAGLKQSLIPGLVERYLESGAGPQFLAMEFVQGTPLDRRVREDNPLPEQLGLHVAEQVLTVLELLHTRLHKSYTDFQLQNIWLLPDQQNIKIMDWNHVSREQNPLPIEQVDADLRRMGAYLYQILTGKGAFQDGETAEALAMRAGELWENLSVGTRHLIRRSLNPNSANRFHSAAEFREAVRRQNQLWLAKADDVVDEAQNLMRPVTKAIAGDSRLSADELAMAETWVDMADRRHPGDQLVRFWKETISKATRDVSAAWGSGMQLLSGKQYREAAAVLRDEASSWGRADLWRQVMIAEAAVELGDGPYQTVATELDMVVGAMNSGDWAKARDLIKAPSLASAYGSALASLRYEIDAQLSYQAARLAYRDGRWEAAAREFRITDDALSHITYVDVLRMQYGWDGIGELAAEAERLAKDAERGDAQTRELAVALDNDLNDGLSQIREALLRRPYSPEIIRLCEREAQRRPATEAVRLLLVALTYGAIPAEQEAALRSAYKEAEVRADQERRRAEEAQRKADEEDRRKQITEKIRGRHWVEVAALLAAMPIRLSAEDIAQVRSAFNTAADGANSLQAQEIASVLDVVEPENAEDRRRRLDDQQARQKAATEAWQAALPAQVQDIMAAGQFDKAREMIGLALPMLPADSPIASFLRDQETQLDEFKAVQTELATIHDKFRSQNLDPDTTDKALDQLEGRIAALGARLSSEATRHLKDGSDALRSDVRLRRARNELDEAVSAISARNYNTAESKLADAAMLLNAVSSGHPGFNEQQDRLMAANARLVRERQAGKTFCDRFGKPIAAVMIALALLLAAGMVFGLVSANRERDARATAEAALGISEANFAIVATELAVLQLPSDADLQAAQTIEALQAQASADAASLAAANASATALAASNEGLSGTVTAAQTTPEPLALTANLAGAAPVAGSTGEGSQVFYDLPTSISVTAPPDWSFSIEPDRGLRLVDPDGDTRTLNLIYTTLVSGTANSNIQAAIPAPAISLNPDAANEAMIDLAAVPVPLPNDPGHYRLGWEAVDDAGNRMIGASTQEFEIVAPPTVVIKSDNNQTYRRQPLWQSNFAVAGGSGLTVEVLGKLDLADAETERGATPPFPDFLMIRLPGSRAVFWLPSWNAELYGNDGSSQAWNDLLNSLPEVTTPEASVTEEE